MPGSWPRTKYVLIFTPGGLPPPRSPGLGGCRPSNPPRVFGGGAAPTRGSGEREPSWERKIILNTRQRTATPLSSGGMHRNYHRASARHLLVYAHHCAYKASFFTLQEHVPHLSETFMVQSAHRAAARAPPFTEPQLTRPLPTRVHPSSTSEIFNRKHTQGLATLVCQFQGHT